MLEEERGADLSPFRSVVSGCTESDFPEDAPFSAPAPASCCDSTCNEVANDWLLEAGEDVGKLPDEILKRGLLNSDELPGNESGDIAPAADDAGTITYFGDTAGFCKLFLNPLIESISVSTHQG